MMKGMMCFIPSQRLTIIIVIIIIIIMITTTLKNNIFNNNNNKVGSGYSNEELLLLREKLDSEILAKGISMDKYIPGWVCCCC